MEMPASLAILSSFSRLPRIERASEISPNCMRTRSPLRYAKRAPEISAAFSVSIRPRARPSSACSFGWNENRGTSPHCLTTLLPDSSGPMGVSGDGIFGSSTSSFTKSFSACDAFSSTVCSSSLTFFPSSILRAAAASFLRRLSSPNSCWVVLRTSARRRSSLISMSFRFLFLMAARTTSGFSRMNLMSNIQGRGTMDSTMHFPIRQIDLREFPPLLREIADPPKHLRIRGDLPRDTLFLTVVGSRKYTPYGKASCERLIEGLRGYPVTIVSGLALGIDNIAHEAALRAGLTTVAVMPSGLSDSVLYPPSHRAVAERILIKGGALLSEFADDFTPQPWSFPQRNRIEAGMAKATLIIEAAERSGTLITARLAMEYNREVLVVPHPIGGESGAGGNRLLREGTTLIRSSDDILEALGMSVEIKQG